MDPTKEHEVAERKDSVRKDARSIKLSGAPLRVFRIYLRLMPAILTIFAFASLLYGSSDAPWFVEAFRTRNISGTALMSFVVGIWYPCVETYFLTRKNVVGLRASRGYKFFLLGIYALLFCALLVVFVDRADVKASARAVFEVSAVALGFFVALFFALCNCGDKLTFPRALLRLVAYFVFVAFVATRFFTITNVMWFFIAVVAVLFADSLYKAIASTREGDRLDKDVLVALQVFFRWSVAVAILFAVVFLVVTRKNSARDRFWRRF